MDQETLGNLLKDLLSVSAETEWLEFKTASENLDIDEIGRYFSALSNEANLKSKDRAWLILGVNNERRIVGTKFKNSVSSLNDLKKYISDGANGSSFIEIHQYYDPNSLRRVLMFEIAPAAPGIPTRWKSLEYGREGESLLLLSDAKKSVILSQDRNDWSGRKCPSATINDLDENAILFLKKKLKEVGNKDEYLNLTDEELLNRLSLITDKTPVNAALVLLGKKESIEKLMPDKVKIAWRYTDEQNNIGERIIFDAPLINKLDEVIAAINRFNVHLKESSLFRKDIKQYEDLALREVLINSLAHRDWSIDLWLEIKQTPTKVAFVNPGIFRADVMAAITRNERPPYLNKRLSETLQKIQLMEREGGGLRKVYRSQLNKGTSVSYDFSKSTQPTVQFVLHGKVEDPEFAQLVLGANKEIEIEDLLLLDQIREGKNKVGVDISAENIILLKSKGYIETRGGKSQRAYISASLAQSVGRESEYVTSKSLPKAAKIVIVLKYLDNFKQLTATQAKKLFPNDPASTIRGLLIEMANSNKIKRVAQGKNRAHWYYIKN